MFLDHCGKVDLHKERDLLLGSAHQVTVEHSAAVDAEGRDELVVLELGEEFCQEEEDLLGDVGGGEVAHHSHCQVESDTLIEGLVQRDHLSINGSTSLSMSWVLVKNSLNLAGSLTESSPSHPSTTPISVLNKCS